MPDPDGQTEFAAPPLHPPEDVPVQGTERSDIQGRPWTSSGIACSWAGERSRKPLFEKQARTRGSSRSVAVMLLQRAVWTEVGAVCEKDLRLIANQGPRDRAGRVTDDL